MRAFFHKYFLKLYNMTCKQRNQNKISKNLFLIHGFLFNELGKSWMNEYMSVWRNRAVTSLYVSVTLNRKTWIKCETNYQNYWGSSRKRARFAWNWDFLVELKLNGFEPSEFFHQLIIKLIPQSLLRICSKSVKDELTNYGNVLQSVILQQLRWLR